MTLVVNCGVSNLDVFGFVVVVLLLGSLGNVTFCFIFSFTGGLSFGGAGAGVAFTGGGLGFEFKTSPSCISGNSSLFSRLNIFSTFIYSYPMAAWNCVGRRLRWTLNRANLSLSDMFVRSGNSSIYSLSRCCRLRLIDSVFCLFSICRTGLSRGFDLTVVADPA